MTLETLSSLPENCWKLIGIAGDGSCERLPREGHCRNCPIFAQEGRKLLDRPLPSGFLADAGRLLAGQKEAEDQEEESFLLFRIGREWLALTTACCHSVAAVRPIHSVPGRSGRTFLGLATIEGELLPCVSGEAILGLAVEAEPEGKPKTARMLVVERRHERVIVPVSEVHGVVGIPKHAVHRPPDTLARFSGALVCGIAETLGRVTGILDGYALQRALSRSLQA